MKKRVLLCAIALTGALALSACGNRATVSDDKETTVENTTEEKTTSEKETTKATDAKEDVSTSQSGDINSFNKSAALLEVDEALTDVKDNVQAGSSGSSLRAVKSAATLLNIAVGTELTPDEIKDEASKWYETLTDDEKSEFKENIKAVDNSYKELLLDGKEELLEAAGCADAPYPWTTNNEPIKKVEVIMEAFGLR